MELSSLRYFLCIADHLNFSRAAEQLYISQPTLSYHISNLEKELGTPLFIREKRKLILTDAGKILREEVQKACKHVDAAIQQISVLTSVSDSLRFGFLELLITPCFNLFVSPFLSCHSDLHGVLERSGCSLLDDLQQGRYDFVFTRQCMLDVYANPVNLCHHTLIKDTFSIAVPLSHPCAKQDSISDLSPLSGSKLLMVDRYISGNIYDPLLKSVLPVYGFALSGPECIVHNMDDLLGQVAAGRGISILPFYTSINLSYQGAKLLRLEGIDSCDANVVLVWNPSRMTPVKQQYIDYIMECFSNPL